jgi:hypothetical protein
MTAMRYTEDQPAGEDVTRAQRVLRIGHGSAGRLREVPAATGDVAGPFQQRHVLHHDGIGLGGEVQDDRVARAGAHLGDQLEHTAVRRAEPVDEGPVEVLALLAGDLVHPCLL